MTRQRTAIAFVAIMLVSVVGVGLVAAAGPSDVFSYSGDDHAPDPTFKDDDLEVAKHPMAEGTTHDEMAAYYDDSGDWVDAKFVVNTTSDVATGDNVNPYTLDPAKIEDPDREEFPRTNDEEGDNTASILDADEWGTEAGSPTVSDTTLAAGVGAVQINADAAGDSVSYANWTSAFDSDEEKRVLQIAGEVNSMDAATDLNISLEDEDGDRKTVQIDPDDSQDTDATTAYGQTSGTFTYQIKLSALPLDDGSGTWDNIQSLNVTANGGKADVSFSWIAFDKKGKTVLGEKQVDDGDSDTDYDNFNTTYNATGTTSTHSIDTLDDDFADASLTEVSFPVKAPMSMSEGAEGEEEAYVYAFENTTAYPGFNAILNLSYRHSLPDAIDLSWSSPTLDLEQGEPSERYLELGVAEDVADSTNLSQASLSDKTGSLGTMDDWVELDGSVTPGQDYVIGFEVKVTDDERAAYTAASTGGGGQFATTSGGGGFLGPVGMVIGSVFAALGFRKIGRWFKGS